MPLPMKTLQEAAAELGMPEKEIRMMIDMRKVRAVWKKNQLTIAPDEIAKIRRLRKSLPESALHSTPAPPKLPPAAAKGAPPKPGAAKPASAAAPKAQPPALKLPPPPPPK